MAPPLTEAQRKGFFMTVAEKKAPAVESGGSVASLAPASVLGALYVIAAFFLVYHGIYYVWETYLGGGAEAGLLEKSLLLILTVGGIAAAALLYLRVVRSQHGVKAGVAFTLIYLFISFWIVYLVCRVVEAWITNTPVVGAVVAAVTAGFLLFYGWSRLQRESAQNWLRDVEDHGWFSPTTYKKGQGLKMRRGTMLGILLIVVSGLWVYSWKGGLVGGATWAINVPFLDPRDWELVLLRSPRIVGPLLILGLAVWFSYRLINYPRFADFLIATEAEMNKVSWASRKKLVQDTIVVLVTVILMAAFLFAVDMLWSVILRWIDVIKF